MQSVRLAGLSASKEQVLAPLGMTSREFDSEQLWLKRAKAMANSESLAKARRSDPGTLWHRAGRHVSGFASRIGGADGRESIFPATRLAG